MVKFYRRADGFLQPRTPNDRYGDFFVSAAVVLCEARGVRDLFKRQAFRRALVEHLRCIPSLMVCRLGSKATISHQSVRHQRCFILPSVTSSFAAAFIPTESRDCHKRHVTVTCLYFYHRLFTVSCCISLSNHSLFRHLSVGHQPILAPPAPQAVCI